MCLLEMMKNNPYLEKLEFWVNKRFSLKYFDYEGFNLYKQMLLSIGQNMRKFNVLPGSLKEDWMAEIYHMVFVSSGAISRDLITY